MSWWKIWGKKNLAASVQVSNLVNQLRGIEGEVSSQVDKGAATQSIQEFVNSSKKVSAQARVCLYVTHVCLQNSDEILPLLRKFENLDNQIRNRKKMDSVRYVRDQAIIWNSLASDFRKFELHTARFSPQDFLNQYGSVEESILKQFEADFSTINSKPISKVGKLTMGSTKNQLTNPSGQAIRQIIEGEKKLEEWFKLLATELNNLSGLHDDMNKAAKTIGGLSGRMGKLARSATAAASAAVESAKGIEEYGEQVLKLQNNLTGSMDKLHDTGVVKLENGTFAKHENEKLTDSEKKRAMLNG